MNKKNKVGFILLEIMNSKRIKKTTRVKNQKFLTGFTLIELLVVLAIIGMLVSTALISIRSARQKSRDVRRVADMKQIKLALEMYFSAWKKYPTVLSDLVGDSEISSIPTDPIGFAPYAYAYCPNIDPQYYHLGASLEEDTNLSLESDNDFDSENPAICDGTNTYTDGFDGTDGIPATPNKCSAAHSGNYCYDLIQ